MGDWLAHLWDAMWPNVFAPSAFTIAAVAVSHLRHGRQLRAEHQRTRDLITKENG